MKTLSSLVTSQPIMHMKPSKASFCYRRIAGDHFWFKVISNIFRLIKYNLVTGETEVLLEGTLGLNGVQKHSDGESVLVNESMGSRIYRYYFTGTKKGTTEIFVDKLPGLPDNIRASEDGKTFWCALYQTRNGGTSTFYQSLGAHPSVRKVLSVLFNVSLHYYFIYWVFSISRTLLV